MHVCIAKKPINVFFLQQGSLGNSILPSFFAGLFLRQFKFGQCDFVTHRRRRLAVFDEGSSIAIARQTNRKPRKTAQLP